MHWIEHRRGEAIPDELLYTKCQTDRDGDGQTPLMYWIRFRRGEAIP